MIGCETVGILSSIRGHADLVRLDAAQRQSLCAEIREFIVSHVAKTGGHLASNLGVVELSVAVETVFNTEVDRLVFDVGHQAYVHKLLTGRQADFERLRMVDGLSGFPKPSESHTDAFVAGHASSSVSIALGMARARHLTGAHYNVVALLGDGAATGGMVYEGLNDLGFSGEPMVVILNDNQMSIDPNVGGMSAYLSRFRTQEGYSNFKRRFKAAMTHVPGGGLISNITHLTKERLKNHLLHDTIFEYMGLEYLGPVDGHDLPMLIQTLEAAKNMGKPVLVHVHTQKGSGYGPAERNPSKYHGVGKFDPVTGEPLSPSQETFSTVFGKTMLSLARNHSNLCAITAAMPAGTGLLGFQKDFPRRLYDVGIAEEHAVSMAGGLAKQGALPVVAIYSTFLQRSYDQIMQDIALLGLHVVLAVDRAGLVGDDGPTHHGVFDVGYLRQIPGMEILCPASHLELEEMLRWAVERCNGPVAVRYPRGGQGAYHGSGFHGDPNALCVHRTGSDVTLLTYGVLTNQVLAAAEALEAGGIHATVVRLLSVGHIDPAALEEVIPQGPVVVVEEACTGSGIREAVAFGLNGHRVMGLDLGADFVPHGDQPTLLHRAGLDGPSIANFVREVLTHEK